MSTQVTSTRRDRRYSIRLAETCRVEFRHPQPSGPGRSAVLKELSVSGLSFAFAGADLGIDTTAKLSDVVVRVGSCEMAGDIVLRYVRSESENTTICGGLFYPASSGDQLKLMSVIAGIEAVLVD